jgi:hypothetical protein
VTTPSVVCVHCRQPCTARFEITRFDAGGAAHGPVVCCSIAHLMAWAYEFATLSGMKLAYGAKSAFDNFMSTLKGLGSK